MSNREMPAPPSVSTEEDVEIQMPVPPVVPRSHPKPIEVVALREGFVRSERKKEGDVFTVASMQKLGSWMRCKDPKIQREHEAILLARKLKANKSSVEVEDSAVE